MGELAQLTIDGGEVRHPPPRPKVSCPECGRKVTLSSAGNLERRYLPFLRACSISRDAGA